jgi:hypothetical protein
MKFDTAIKMVRRPAEDDMSMRDYESLTYSTNVRVTFGDDRVSISRRGSVRVIPAK